MKREFDKKVNLFEENSTVVTREENGVVIHVSYWKKENDGGFEIYDVETSGESWYAEGILEFDRKNVIGFDGVFDLPNVLKEDLINQGFNLSEL